MDGTDLCFEIVRRASAGFVYSEAVARSVTLLLFSSQHILGVGLENGLDFSFIFNLDFPELSDQSLVVFMTEIGLTKKKIKLIIVPGVVPFICSVIISGTTSNIDHLFCKHQNSK